jgi:hypothetical protein
MTLTTSFLLLQLRTAGVLLALLAVLNVFVPRRFRWREEMARLSLLNRQIFQVHAIFLVLTLALFSALLLTTGAALLERTPLARAVLAGLTIFWAMRMLVQWFYYSPATWRGHRFNTVMHVLFSGLWIYLTGVFGASFYFVAVH